VASLKVALRRRTQFAATTKTQCYFCPPPTQKKKKLKGNKKVYNKIKTKVITEREAMRVRWRQKDCVPWGTTLKLKPIR